MGVFKINTETAASDTTSQETKSTIDWNGLISSSITGITSVATSYFDYKQASIQPGGADFTNKQITPDVFGSNQNTTKTKDNGNNNTLLIVLGVAVVGVLLYMVLKK